MNPILANPGYFHRADVDLDLDLDLDLDSDLNSQVMDSFSRAFRRRVVQVRA
jgi:hypothetical protein